MSTQNVNVARFARNVERDFFCDFQTPWIAFENFKILFCYCCRWSQKVWKKIFEWPLNLIIIGKLMLGLAVLIFLCKFLRCCLSSNTNQQNTNWTKNQSWAKIIKNCLISIFTHNILLILFVSLIYQKVWIFRAKNLACCKMRPFSVICNHCDTSSKCVVMSRKPLENFRSLIGHRSVLHPFWWVLTFIS